MKLTKTKLCLLSGFVGAAALTMAGNVHAQFKPSLSGSVVLELQNEYNTDSDDQTVNDYNNLFFRSEVAPTLTLTENLAIDGVLVFENIQDPDPFESNFFDNEGAFIEELKLNYQNGNFYALLGKFNPSFGIAWDYGRGIFGEDFAEDYEITERIGGAFNYNIQTPNHGLHTVSASSFFADTSFLSGSVFTGRGELDESDGGTANTQDLSSVVFSVEGGDMPALPNLSYKLAYRNQAEGDADPNGTRETGFAATLGYVQPVNDNVEVDLLLEYVDIDNFDTSDNDNRYLYANAITTFNDNWNVTVGYTLRNVEGPDVQDDDHLLQITGGYNFGQGTTAEIGWRNTEISESDTDVIGGLIRHTLVF